jgi:hypothetical protein
MTEATVQFTDAFAVEALRHYRRQHGARRPLLILKAVMALLLLALSVFVWFQGSLGLVFFFVGLSLLLLWGHHIDFWLARRSLRKWAFRNETASVEITDEHFRVSSPKQETTLRWAGFTRMVEFGDGFLFFHGPASFHWLPVSALSPSADLGALKALLRSKIPVHRIVEPVESGNRRHASRI